MDPRLGFSLLVAACLLQLPAVLLLARYVELEEESPWRPARGYETHPARRPGEQDEPDAGDGAPEPLPGRASVCRRCGAENDRGYTYCRSCVAAL